MNRKSENKNIRKLAKSGKTSLAVTIPRDFIVELGWREKQKVVVKKQGKTITISDWPQNQ
jgi:antitoxin component of MazEF toxin-antitoxin module